MSSAGSLKENWIAVVSTYPPRACGIATFTEDLTGALDILFSPIIKTKIVAMNQSDLARYRYGSKVVWEIDQNKEEDYVAVARQLNNDQRVRAVSLQHEFGIFGGRKGVYILSFLKNLKKPLVATLHTVLPKPKSEMLFLIKEIALKAEQVVVLTNYSRKILERDYGVDGAKIAVVPHGIHHRPYVFSGSAKRVLHLREKTIISTFGLLSSGKGLEYAIQSLPRVVAEFPGVVYLILGATHPDIIKKEGEAYRTRLVKQVYALGLSGQVKFFNQYLPLSKLLQFLEATDIYLSTSTNPHQAVSGTLSYAMGAGRAVISTPFVQAKEEVTSEVGILVDFKNSEAYSEAIIRLVKNKGLRKQLGKAAYYKTRRMIWPNVAREYLKIFTKFSLALKEAEVQKTLPPIKLKHLLRLTDKFGIWQFAKLTKPNPKFGYTLDDNARALLAVGLEYQRIITLKDKTEGVKRKLKELLEIYLDFIDFVTKTDGRRENYVDRNRIIDRALNDKDSLEDANARAMYALAAVSAISGLPETVRNKARLLFLKSFNSGMRFESLRSSSFYIKALAIFYGSQEGVLKKRALEEIEKYGDRLLFFYQKNADCDWRWFESFLTYSNALLPEALFWSYWATNKSKYLKVGQESLNFLMEKTFTKDMYLPIGQDGWYFKDGERCLFDQQPEDPCAMIQALQTAYTVCGDSFYKDSAKKAFDWFLGNNTLGRMVYDSKTGGCFDGVREKEINLNQGAESTIAYLLARLSFEVDIFSFLKK